MSTRPRIRTLKPEMWQDERVGTLSRDARLLLLGLVTLADDEGRFACPMPRIIGHCFPWDDDITPAKVSRWLEEIAAQGIVLLYRSEGRPYGAFRHWRRHQRVNRATPSTLPSSPDDAVTAENAVPDHGERTTNAVRNHEAFTESSLNAHTPTRRRAFRSDPSSTETSEDQEQADARAPDREHVLLSQLLADLIRQRDPKAKAAPLSKGWLDAIRLLIERDGRTPAEVERVIRWCQADAFWQSNILSAPKLRAKFDQLAAKAGTPGRLPQPGAAEADALVVQWLDKEPEYEAMRRPA